MMPPIATAAIMYQISGIGLILVVHRIGTLCPALPEESRDEREREDREGGEQLLSLIHI